MLAEQTPGDSTLSIVWYQGRRSLDRAAPVGRPAQIGGIDVGRQAFLEAVELVGPDEVHLSGQAGGIAGGPQMVGNVGSEARSSAALSNTPVREGSRPVRSAAREGEHSGEGQYAFSNTTPARASAVTFGARTTGCP